jgi:hypothetical protein
MVSDNNRKKEDRAMKLTALASLMLFFVSVSLTQQKREVTVTGEVVDMQCYISGAMGKATGPEHKECATNCAKGGIPIGILEEKTGNLVFAGQTKNAMKGANEMLIDLIAERVTVTGRMVEKGGVKLLLISKVLKAK